jgi:hypothetical protein
MAAATAVGDRCPVCDMPNPCPTQPQCLLLWGEVLLAMISDTVREGDDE